MKTIETSVFGRLYILCVLFGAIVSYQLMNATVGLA
jgi:hypothetical protein